MSANVWFEQVERGLIKEIKETVKCKNHKGILTPLDDNAIIIRKPEEDFKIEVFPSVSIYNTSYKFDSLRYNSQPIVVDVNEEEKTLLMEESAIPFNLDYQLDFWSEYQEDMNDMTRTWLMKHFRQFNLNVVDDGGVERSCNCSMTNSITKSDIVTGDKRLFHSIISYRIWVELDDQTRYNVSMVTDTNINV